MTRLRRRSRLARPYICLLIALTRLTLPSVGPELWRRVSPAVTAGQVLADPGGEGVQFGLVVGFDALEPGGQLLFSGAFGHHLGEAGHMPGEAVELGAVAAQAGEQLLLAGVEVFGPAK